jgi:hypothetical protein
MDDILDPEEKIYSLLRLILKEANPDYVIELPREHFGTFVKWHMNLNLVMSLKLIQSSWVAVALPKIKRILFIVNMVF